MMPASLGGGGSRCKYPNTRKLLCRLIVFVCGPGVYCTLYIVLGEGRNWAGLRSLVLAVPPPQLGNPSTIESVSDPSGTSGFCGDVWIIV